MRVPADLRCSNVPCSVGRTRPSGARRDSDGAMNQIVHIGVGNFHRSHQAMYVHRLGDPDWTICGVGMLPGDASVRDGLTAQAGAYSLVLKHPDGSVEREVITSIREMLLAPEDPWAVVARLADADTRIVSLTITEGGYNVDAATGEFLAQTPAVQADLHTGAAPTTVLGVVVRALQRRRAAKIPPFTVVSCDNIEGNGHVARRAFTAFATLVDPELGAWVSHAVRFPNCMVDRITPVTVEADRILIRAKWGVEDRVPVTAEPFTQWVLEDDFSNGRPALEEVGVQFVSDVRPYELMKLRLLNASHQAIAYYGMFLGHEFVHDAASDPLVVTLMTRYMDEEATGSLQPVAGIDLATYKAALVQRFANPWIADTLRRLAAFGSDRIPKFLLPVIRHNLRTGGPTALSIAIVASWLRWLEQASDVVDNRWKGQPPEDFLLDGHVFGDLTGHSGFQSLMRAELARVRASGPRDALADLLA
ncbi:MAG: mannitol dehydrogenase family protein [Mycobacteriales bacterium]